MPIKLAHQLLSAAMVSALVLAPTVAFAEPPPDPPAQPSAEQLERARELFENGKGLYREGSYEAAIAAFKRAYGQSGDPVLLYNIALAYDRANKFEEALEYLEYYRAYAPESEREMLAEKEESLRKRRLRAESEAAAAAENAPDAAATPPPAAATEPARTDGPPPPAAPKQKIFTTPVWIFSGVAVVGLGLGTGLGVAALGRSSDAEAACTGDGTGGTVCPMSAERDARAARNLGLGSDVSFAVGAVSGVVAIALIVNNVVKGKKASTTAFVPTRGGAGLAIRF